MMEVSVVSAMAARPGRSRSKRPTNSAAKCCASPAEPPLPQASTLPPPVMAPTRALTASAMGLARISAAAYLRSALSKNCCWIRCSSMGQDDKSPVKDPHVASRGVERRLDPLDAPALDCHHVEAARRQRAAVTQEMMRREHDAALLGVGDASRRTAEARTPALAHLDEHHRPVAVAQDQVHLAAPGPRPPGHPIIAPQQREAVALHVLQGK